MSVYDTRYRRRTAWHQPTATPDAPSARHAPSSTPSGWPLFLGGRRTMPPGVTPTKTAAQAGRAGQPATEIDTGVIGDHLPGTTRVYDDAHAHRAAAQLNAHAYTYQGDIVLGAGLGSARGAVLDHELVHTRQSRRAGSPASPQALESEAHAGGAGTLTADPDTPHPWAWIIPPLLAGAYTLLRPNVANAPGPGDKTYPSVSPLQVGAEAIALFGIPGGAGKALLSRGWSVVAVAGTEGAIGAAGYRGVQDIFGGEFSGVSAYVVDVSTGVLLGVFIGGTFQTFKNWRAARQAAQEGAPGTAPTGSTGPSQAPDELFHHTDEASVGKIHESGSIWGKTEGRVYATPFENIDDPLSRAWHTGVTQKPTGTVKLTGEAAEQFQRHPEEGWYSGLWKRKGGQYVTKKPGHDLAFDPNQATRSGSTLTVSEAQLQKQAMADYLKGYSRLWGRRLLIDWGIPAASGGSMMIYGGAFTNYPTTRGTRLPAAGTGESQQGAMRGPVQDPAPIPQTEADLPPGAPIIYVSTEPQALDDPFAVSKIGYSDVCPSCHDRIRQEEPVPMDAFPSLSGQDADQSMLFDLVQQPRQDVNLSDEELEALRQYLEGVR